MAKRTTSAWSKLKFKMHLYLVHHALCAFALMSLCINASANVNRHPSEGLQKVNKSLGKTIMKRPNRPDISSLNTCSSKSMSGIHQLDSRKRINPNDNELLKKAPKQSVSSNDDIINGNYVAFRYICSYNENNDLIPQDPFYESGGVSFKEFDDYPGQLYCAGLFWSDKGYSYYIPINIDYYTSEVEFYYGYLLDNDTLISGGKNRVDTIYYSTLISQDYYLYGNKNNVLGTLYDDGSIIFDDNYVFSGYYIYLTYRNNQLVSRDSIHFEKVYWGTELLRANAEHKCEYKGTSTTPYTFIENVYMFQTNDTIYSGNLFGFGHPWNMMLLEGPDNMSYPEQVVLDEKDGDYFNGSFTLTDNHDFITDNDGNIIGFNGFGNTGKVSSDRITWDATVLTTAGGIPGYNPFYNNELYFTNGNAFDLPKPNNLGETFQVNGLFYEVTGWNEVEVAPADYDNDGAISISDVTYAASLGVFGDIVIPESITYQGKSYDVTAIGSVAFPGVGYNITSITMPSTIRTIGEGAFGLGFSDTKLEYIICNALTPPLAADAFCYCPTTVLDGTILYVPGSVISDYENADIWKQFTIMPGIGAVKLTVSFSDHIDIARYSNMKLEIAEKESDKNIYVVITAKKDYTFGLESNAVYDVTVKNQYGDELGKIDSFNVYDDNATVTFSSLKEPQAVELSIKTPDGKDVTDISRVSWKDENGEFLKEGKQIYGLPSGRKLLYGISLPQDLAASYITPTGNIYEVKDSYNNVICELENYGQKYVVGTVLDSVTKQPIDHATVTAVQSFEGAYTQTQFVDTGDDGHFSFNLKCTPTTLYIMAADYAGKKYVIDSLMEGNDNCTIPNIYLEHGAIIDVQFTKTISGLEDESTEVLGWYDDGQNVDYEIFNKSKNREINYYNIQYPKIVIEEKVDDGDVIQITATSRNEKFMPVASTTIIENQHGDVVINIIELGKIKASFKKNANYSVVGVLYDSNGKLMKTQDYKDATLTLSDIKDGVYSLVTMGKAPTYISLNDINQLRNFGLFENTHYRKSRLWVKSGLITECEIDQVPTLGEAALCTGKNTSFSVNKTNVVIGDYLTLNGRVDFKDEYIDKVRNVELIVDLPDKCILAESSVMVGNVISEYRIEENQIIIPVNEFSQLIRLCIIPTLRGDFASNTYVKFEIDNDTLYQPIASAEFKAQDLSISVPRTTTKKSIPIYGVAAAGSSIEVYDNDVMIGQTSSLENGTWSISCELKDPYQASRHNIFAKVRTPKNIELLTRNTICLYDESAPQVSKVKMYHENPEMRKTYELTFDFLNPSNINESYIYYIYNRTFSFTIEFTENDPEVVSNVMLYVKTAKNKWIPLNASYDNEKGLWVTAGEFGNRYDGDLPVSVAVDYDCLNYNPLDSTHLIGEMRNDYNVISINDYQKDNDTETFTIIPQDPSLSMRCLYYQTSIANKDIVYERVLKTSLQEIEVIDSLSGKYFINNEFESLMIKEDGDSIYVFALCQNNESSSIYELIESLNGRSYIKKSPQKAWQFDPEADRVPDATDALNQWTNSLIADIINEANQKLPCASLFDKIQMNFAIHYLRLVAVIHRLHFFANVWQWFHVIPNTNPAERIWNTYQAIDGSNSFVNGIHNMSWFTRQQLNYIRDAQTCPDPNNNFHGHPYNGHDKTFCIDPSGFVYEGVPSNRLQGVTATCYYKETVEDMYGDPVENVVLWDAEQYGQENPLITDENGYYRWDVPIGMWQVKYEKEGYETTYSDWLPVPPPQLDVNIGMVQMRQPEVIKARAYPKAVEFEFDKYMLPETLTTDNIRVLVNGTAVNGTIELLNAEVDDPLAITSIRRAPGTGLTFASRVRFNADQPFNASQVTLQVKQEVESYAGLQMNEDYEAVLPVELEMQEIVADSVIILPYHESKQLTVTVLPAAASTGKLINVTTTSTIIASTEAEQYVLDNNGKAVITVHGDLPGMTSLLFSIDGYDLTAATLVNVMMENQMTVAAPTASIASGSEVEKGTAVYLRCSTPDATIYYTLDGSCPCDPTPARKVYDGNPIIIDATTTIKAMATVDGLYDSEVATFVYRVNGGLKGDVNNDGEVNIADINVIISIILGGSVNPDTYEKADVNDDDEVNIADINVIISIILSPDYLMSHKVNCDDKLRLGNVSIKPGEVKTLQVTVDNASHYSAMQCDIVLPEGLTLVSAASTGGNVSKIGYLDEMSSRALSYSANKTPFMDNGQGIMSITVLANAALASESEIKLTNVVLADDENKAWYLSDCKARVNNTSGVNDLTAINNRVWTEDAYLCIESQQNGIARITTISGIMYEVVVNSGITRYELAPGIYVVTLNGNSYKIAIK